MPHRSNKMWMCPVDHFNPTFQEPSVNWICKMLVGSLLSCKKTSFASTKRLAGTAVLRGGGGVEGWLALGCECRWQRWHFWLTGFSAVPPCCRWEAKAHAGSRAACKALASLGEALSEVFGRSFSHRDRVPLASCHQEPEKAPHDTWVCRLLR